MLSFYLALLKELLLSPTQFFAWVADDDNGHAQPLVVTLWACIVTAIGSVAAAASQPPPPGREFGLVGAVVITLFVFVTLIISVYFAGALCLVGAKLFGGRDATFGQGVRLAAGVFWLSAVLTIPAVLVAAKSLGFAMTLLALAMLYVLYINGRGLIEGMGAHPVPVWIVGALLALPTVAGPFAATRLSHPKRDAQFQALREESEEERQAREEEERRAQAEAEERIALARAQDAREQQEQDEAAARLREKMQQAAAEKGGDFLEVRINSIPPNAQVVTKDGSEQLGTTPTTAKFHKSRFPVVLTLTAPSGKTVDYEVSSLQGAVTVMIPD